MSPPPYTERFFTREQANALLEIIEEILNTAANAQTVLSNSDLFKEALTGAPGNGGGTAVNERTQALLTLNASLMHLLGLGVEVRSLDQGLIDFPAHLEGRKIYLCWKRGEPEVFFWHEVNTGFAGRQPLDE